MIEIIPVINFPIIKKNDNIGEIIINTFGIDNIKNNDILVIAQTIVSRAEDQVVNLDKINPSDFAIELGKQSKKDPRHI